MSAADSQFPSTAGVNGNETGKRFGYGNWLQPIIRANDKSESTPEVFEQLRSSPPALPRRGRGRPPVTKPRNESAIEKRRAQVREAQRTYQKRKDTATATEKRRVDELLQLLSDLSSDVESLLQTASREGNMYRDDETSKNIQRLWSTYNTVINNECINPELRLLQNKNNRRLVTHQTNSNPHVVTGTSVSQEELEPGVVLPSSKSSIPFDPSALSFELVRFEGTTVMSTYQRTAATDQYMAGRSIFDVVKERQTAMKEAERRQAEGES